MSDDERTSETKKPGLLGRLFGARPTAPVEPPPATVAPEPEQKRSWWRRL